MRQIGGRCAVLIAVVLAVVIVTPASAAAVRSGWWTQTGAASAVLDSDVPPGGMLVQAGPNGPIAVAAVAVDALLSTVVVPVVGQAVMTSPVRACRLTGVFTPVQGGQWADAPPYDCTGAVQAKQAGTNLTFTLGPLAIDGVVLVASGQADRVALGPPTVVLADGPAAQAPAPPSPTAAGPSTDAWPVPAAGGIQLPPLSAAQPVLSPSATAPVPTTLQAPATRPLVAVSPAVSSPHGATRRTLGTLLAVALLLALLVYWTDGFGAGSWRAGSSSPLPISEAPMTQPDLPELVRHEVRRQLAAGPRRYAPLAAGMAAVLALVVLVPDARNGSNAASLNGPTAGQPLSPGGSTGGGTGPASSTGVTTPGSTGTSGGTTPAGSTGVAGPSTSGANPGSGTTGTTGSTGGTVNAQGVARNGTKCGQGVRQFAFVPYSPLCVPKFTGDNGGATAHGVTKDSITFVLRNPTDYDGARSAVAASTFAEALHDTQVMVKVFNSQFELYGRQVVIKSFSGRGSFIAEAAGQDQAGASADAQTAYDAGAFASGIPPDPQVYQNALSSRGVISFGLNSQGTVASSRKAYPYEYQSLGPIADFQAIGVADIICGRMAKMPAVFAGDPLLAKQTRSFGLVLSQQAQTADGGTNQIPNLVKKECGQTVRTYTYQGNPASNASDASSIATQAKADGTTTLVLISDLLFAPNMTTAAVQSGYKPEWIVPTLNRDQTARQMDATAVKSMVFVHPWKAQSYPANKASCYRIYKMGDPNGEPQSDQYAGATFDSNCVLLLELFGALQAAGPRLTPATFGQGFFSLPASAGAGDFGAWSYAKDHYSPDSTYTLQYWNPSGTNPYDNGTGYYVNCREASDTPYVGPKSGSGQLRCLGR